MKFCIFLSICIALVWYGISSPTAVGLEDIACGTYSFYSTDKVESRYITKTIDLSFSYIYECSSSDADKLRKLFTRIDGESVAFADTVNVNTVLKKLGARRVLENNFGIYAYTPKIKSHIQDNNKKINLQIVQSGDKTIIGFPVILGSY